jgi:hypothetical protein
MRVMSLRRYIENWSPSYDYLILKTEPAGNWEVMVRLVVPLLSFRILSPKAIPVVPFGKVNELAVEVAKVMSV